MRGKIRLTRRDWLKLTGASAASAYGASAVPAADAKAQADRATQWPPPGAGMTPTPARKPGYPLKTDRTLHTDAEIAQARQNIERFPDARARLNEIEKAAKAWLSWSDADLARLVTPASAPRAFDVGATVGCPKCGQTIHEKFGSYPWLVDLRKPFKLTCPVDGSVYPDNDYAAFLESGFTKKIGWDKPVVDDGWGWRNPKNGERYWFVAHYNHRVWHRHLGPGLDALGNAYLLTGKKEYAHKAAVLLWHIAQVYPAMDHEKQSRYGLLSKARGIRYPGKVLNHIWETALATGFARTYDAIWETLDTDHELQKTAQLYGRGLRGFMEANLLEEIIDGYYRGQIVGNYGMHQSTVAHTAVVRQHGDSAKWIGGLLDGKDAPTKAPGYLGLRYALYNSIFRDGVPSESAAGYNGLWVSKITDLAVLLQKGGRDLFAEEPRLRQLYDAQIAQVNIQNFTPDWGDSGSVWGDQSTGRSPNVFLPAARAYHEPAFARFVATQASGGVAFPTVETVFLPPAGAEAGGKNDVVPLPRSSRLLDGVGLGVLCNPADTISTTLTYGWKAGHGHFDRLNFELFAGGTSQTGLTDGVPLMPDLGYPDAMNDYVSGIYTWNKNTVAHNTVVVDGSRQTGNMPGAVKLFAQSPFARVLDVDAPGTYDQTHQYRRALIMVDTGDTNDKNGAAYFVDVFSVAGGHQHDYSLHGPPGSYKPESAVGWGEPEPGTLAGRNVPLGQIYDNAKMSEADYKGGFNAYTGSGFQHLFNVRRKTASGETGFVEWRHEKKPDVRLRVRVLPQTEQELLLADAWTTPIKKDGRIGYLIARRTGSRGSANLTSRFVSVIEPITGADPLIESVHALSLHQGDGVALEVVRKNGAVDLILYDPGATAKCVQWGSGPNAQTVATDAQTVVLSRAANGDGQVRRVLLAGLPSGCTLSVGSRTFHAAGCSAIIADVFPQQNQIRLANTQGAVPKVGDIVYLANAQRTVPAAYTVAAVVRNGDSVTLTTKESLLVGRAPLKSANGSTLTFDMALPIAATYPGAAVYAGLGEAKAAAPPCGVVANADPVGTLRLTGRPTGALPPIGNDLWLAHAAPGDTLTMPSFYAETLV